MEGLDCDPNGKDTSHAACRAAPKWQAQINPPGGRHDLTTDCASEPSGREAPCDRGKRPLHVATKATAPEIMKWP